MLWPGDEMLCGRLRPLLRELLSSCLLRPVLMLASPHTVNRVGSKVARHEGKASDEGWNQLPTGWAGGGGRWSRVTHYAVRGRELGRHNARGLKRVDMQVCTADPSGVSPCKQASNDSRGAVTPLT